MPEVNAGIDPGQGGARAIARHLSPSPKKLSLDDLVDGAIENQESDKAQRAAAKAKKAGATAPGIPSVEDLTEQVLDDQEPEEQEEPQEHEEPEEQELQDDDGEAQEADTRGSREDPFKATDLPKDKFIKLKVDGEELVVSIAELGSGYVREKTFHQRVEKMQGHMAQLEAIVKDATQSKTGVRQEIVDLFNDPERLHEILRARFEGTLHEIAKRRAADVRHWDQYPGTRERFLAEKQQKELELKQQAFTAEQETAQRTQREQAVIEQRVKVLRPGWLEGLRQAGNPAVDPEFTALVGSLMQRQLETTKKLLTSEDVAKIVVRVAKVLGAKPASATKPKPADIMGTRPARTERSGTGQRGGKDYSKLTQKQRNKDPDYFLSGFKGLR